MTQLNSSLLIVAGLILVLSLVSRLTKQSSVTDPIVALTLGVLVGPSVLGVLVPASWGNQEVIVEQVTRLTLAIGLMGVALRIPPRYFQREWRSVAVLLGLVMPAMWLMSGLIAYMFLAVPFWVAMLIGGVITPTDPVVSTTIVTGPTAEDNLPARLRRALSAESGANDGLAYPFVLLPILMLERSEGDALSHWIVHTVLWDIGATAPLALVVGYGAGRLLRKAESRHTVEQPSLLGFTLALSLAVLGGAGVLGTNGVFAVFVAGIAFDNAATGEQDREYAVQEAVNRFFNLPVFVLLGLVMLWREWLDLGWRAVAIVGCVMLLRRVPAMLLMRSLLPATTNLRDALFLGWFGPIGAAALYYASHAWGRTGLEQVWIVATLVVCASVVMHGVTAAPWTKWYGKRERTTAAGGDA